MHHSHGGFLRCLQPAPFISPAAEAEDDREKILSFFSQAIVVPNRPILIWGALDDAFFLQAGQTGRHQCDDIPFCAWNSSNRLLPKTSSPLTTMGQRSPITDTDRA